MIPPGFSKDPVYRTWHEVMRRCYDKRRKGYKKYGAVGITVCEFLRCSPVNLLIQIGPKPSKTHSIDRIDNLGNYSCGTCSECLEKRWPCNIRWATPTEQARNRNYVHHITAFGKTQTAPEWSEEMSIPYRTIKARLMSGLTGEELLVPKKTYRKFLFDGKYLTIPEISKLSSIPKATLFYRVRPGKTFNADEVFSDIRRAG